MLSDLTRVISLQPYHIPGGQLGMCLLHWKTASNCGQQDGEEKQTAIRLLASLPGYRINDLLIYTLTGTHFTA